MAYAPASDTPNAGGGRLSGSKRITITLSDSTYKALVERSADEARSISNMVSCLVERALAKRAERETP